MKAPIYEELEPQLKQVLNPEKARAVEMVAKGVAPLPPPVLVSCWAYLIQRGEEALADFAKKSLNEYPVGSVKPTLSLKLPAWVLYFLGQHFKEDEALLEPILLNSSTPSDLFVKVASSCSERICGIIANNQERIIESPEIIFELEQNPNNLKSTSDRLRQFLNLAGILVTPAKQEAKAEEEKTDETAQVEPEDEVVLEEAQRISLQNQINTLSTGAKVKLAMKGNKEARGILIKDSNKIVSVAVLKSPKLNENEIIHYSGMKNIADDVIRVISRHPGWTKAYAVKLNLINHPKTPLATSIQFLKFLNLRDLQQVSKSRTVIGPVRKAAKELVMKKRK